jgi:hypothetical protein
MTSNFTARRHAMLTRFIRLSRHPLSPLLALLAANALFYIGVASAFA